MMNVKLFFLSAVMLTAMFFAGCASVDEISESDITVEMLEAKMAKKNDAAGLYRKSSGVLFRQVVKVPQLLDVDLETVLETKMIMPDKFRITTLKENQPVQVICSNGERGWIADLPGKKLHTLDGEQLQQLLTMARLSTPGAGYRTIFEKVEIFRCSNDDGEFYLLICSGKKDNKFRFYVDADDFVLRRMCGKIKVGSGELDYDSRIKSYGLYNGVMIPKVTETIQNGQKQIIELLNYELNPAVSGNEFAPPVF